MGRACGYEFLPGSQATPHGAVTKRLTYIFPFEDGGMCVSVLVCLFFLRTRLSLHRVGYRRGKNMDPIKLV